MSIEQTKPQEVYVMVGFYSDRSGAQILGVYNTLKEAEDRKTIADAIGGAQSINYVRMPVGIASPQWII